MAGAGNIAGFDWDAGNREKCRKHGVSIDEIEGVFGQPLTIILPDSVHSGDEERLIAAGLTMAGRPVFVAFARRDVNGVSLIRPISARYMHAKEASRYAEARTALRDR